jgi:hypothetical protein
VNPDCDFRSKFERIPSQWNGATGRSRISSDTWNGFSRKVAPSVFSSAQKGPRENAIRLRLSLSTTAQILIPPSVSDLTQE